MLALAYQDNGEFNIKVVTRTSKSLMRGENLVEFEPGQVICDVCIQKLFQLDFGSKPIHGIYNPLITACFLPNNRLFVCAYHRYKKRQYHFVYSLTDNRVEGAPEHVDFS